MALAVSLDMTRKAASRHLTDMIENMGKNRAARVSFRSVFDVEGARLAIGHFNRSLGEEECGALRRAWERSRLPEVEDFEVSSRQVSFLSPTPRVDSTWRAIDALLATSSLAKAS